MAAGTYTVTVNADARFYLDGGRLDNGSSLLETITTFNDAKISLYNALYDNKYLGTGPLSPSCGGKTDTAFLKERWKLNDYYCAAVHTEASAVLKSQAALLSLELEEKEAGLEARRQKIRDTRETLVRKQRTKDAVKEYLCTGSWKKLLPGTVKDGHIYYGDWDCGPAEDYERRLEAGIRRLKTKIKLLEEALRRAERRLAKRKEEGIRRAVFGGKAFYKTKDTTSPDMAEWKEEYRFRRHCSMGLPGRHTSVCGNFLVKYDPVSGNLCVRCMDGKDAVFHGFRPARFREEFLSLFGRQPRDRESVAYRFLLHRDSAGIYFTVSVTMTLSHTHQNVGFDSGCVAIDLNPDRIAAADISSDGELLRHFSVPLRLDGKSSGQAACAIGEAMAKIGDYCREQKKCLVMENLDFTSSKQGLKYGNRDYNRMLSSFAYRKMATCAAAQAYKHSFTVYTVNPAYTSAAGKLLYMRKYGCPVHEAAAYVIGLSAMGLADRFRPPEWMGKAAKAASRAKAVKQPEEKKEQPQEKSTPEAKPKDCAKEPEKKPRHTVYKNPVTVSADSCVAVICGKEWRVLMKYMKGVPLHAFYMKPDEDDWGRRKHTVKMYFKVLKEKAERQELYQKALSARKTA